jgi:hypothetical protein
MSPSIWATSPSRAAGTATSRLSRSPPRTGARTRARRPSWTSASAALSFDPLAFSQKSDREQLATLLSLVELPFDPSELADKRQVTYDRRTEIGRGVKALEGQLAGVARPAVREPREELRIADVAAEYRAAQEQYAEHGALRNAHVAAMDRVARLTEELASATEEEARLAERVVRYPEVPDLIALETAMSTIEEANRAIRDEANAVARYEQLDAEREKVAKLTERLEQIDAFKAESLAEATMPIEGLSFDDEGVLYRGVPFAQCSAAERLRVSMAMAMAMNPSIRVLRICDGSLLDSSNLALIEEMAGEHAFQVWIERVSDTGEIGFVVEDGEIVSVPAAVS